MSEFSVGRRGKIIEVHEAVTDEAGLAVITYDQEFAERPMVLVDIVPPAGPRIIWDKLAEARGGCTIRVRQPAVVVADGASVLSSTLEAVAAQPIRVMIVEC